MILKRFVAACAAIMMAAAFSAASPASAASCSGTGCYTMKDGNLAPQSVKANTLGDGTIVPMSTPVDATGTPFSSANPLFMQLVGSTVGVTSLPALPAGTNAIGTVGVTSLPALPAGTNNIGTVGLSGLLPAFAATPTVNLGTLNGAATAAKQPAIGVAGTPAADVLTVQGAASGTPLPVLDQQLYNAITNGATPTSTKGTPTGQMLTVQDGNAVLGFPSVSSTATGVVGSAVSLGNDGTPYTTFALEVSSMATGGSLSIQCSIAGTNFYNLRVNQAVSEVVSGSIGGTGIYEADVSGCAIVRVSQNAYTSGTTTVQGIFKKAAFAPRTITINSGLSGAGTSLTGGMNRNALRGSTGLPTAVSDATAVDPLATSIGAIVTKPYGLPALDWSSPAVANGNTGTASTTIVNASTGNRQYVTELDFVNASATPTEIVVYDGSTSGAVLYRGFAPANMPLPFSVPIPSPLHSTAGNGIVYALGTTGSKTYLNATGYTAP